MQHYHLLAPHGSPLGVGCLTWLLWHKQNTEGVLQKKQKKHDVLLTVLRAKFHFGSTDNNALILDQYLSGLHWYCFSYIHTDVAQSILWIISIDDTYCKFGSLCNSLYQKFLR